VLLAREAVLIGVTTAKDVVLALDIFLFVNALLQTYSRDLAYA
jgi:hypothetical protein